MFVLGGCLRWIAVLRLFDVVLVAGVLLCWGMFVIVNIVVVVG